MLIKMWTEFKYSYFPSLPLLAMAGGLCWPVSCVIVSFVFRAAGKWSHNSTGVLIRAMETAPTEAPVFMSRHRFAQTILCCYNNSAPGQGRRKTAVRCGVRSHIPPWTSRLCYCEQFNIQTRNKSLNIIWPLLTKNMNILTIYPCFLSPGTGLDTDIDSSVLFNQLRTLPELNYPAHCLEKDKTWFWESETLLQFCAGACVLWSLSSMAAQTKRYPLVLLCWMWKNTFETYFNAILTSSHQDSQERYVLEITRNPSNRSFYQKIHLSFATGVKLPGSWLLFWKVLTWGGRIPVILTSPSPKFHVWTKP